MLLLFFLAGFNLAIHKLSRDETAERNHFLADSAGEAAIFQISESSA